MNTAKYCTEMFKHKKAFSKPPDPLTRGFANEPSLLILSRTDNLRFLNS